MRVAVVGSGPSGLACAWGLARLGHDVHVHERAPLPGGLLRYGIPSYRLPKDVLDREIERIRTLGVRLTCGLPIGGDGSRNALRQLLGSFDAVYVAIGAARSRSLSLAGAAGALSALEFLALIASDTPPEPGPECLVIGGGNSAVDAARCARRLGARSTIVYRRSRAEMPAFESEVDDALAEGVRLIELAAPVGLVLEQGKLAGVRCLRTRLGEPDRSGRRAPVPIEGSEFELPASLLVNALGEEPDAESLTADSDLLAAFREADGWGHSPVHALFLGGDFAGSERTVAHAIGSGKRAAMAIDHYLRGQEREELDRYRIAGGPASMAAYLNDGATALATASRTVIEYEDLNTAYFPRNPRHGLPRRTLHQSERRGGFGEVESGFDGPTAQAESARCCSCGRCTRCGNCQVFCPEGAVRADTGAGDLVILDAHCKGCGICVEECPRGAIEMGPER